MEARRAANQEPFRLDKVFLQTFFVLFPRRAILLNRQQGSEVGIATCRHGLPHKIGIYVEAEKVFDE